MRSHDPFLARIGKPAFAAALAFAALSFAGIAFAGIAHAAGEPVVTTVDAQDVLSSFAQMGFTVNDAGASTITEYGVKYATDTDYTGSGDNYNATSSIHSAVASNTGGYMYVYDLACNTTYHFAAFATNGNGTGMGEDATFTTSTCPPVSPNITLNSPARGSTVTSWAPSVTWEDAATCAYSYDDSTFTDVDCAAEGSDIPAPAAGDVNLYLRAVSSDNLEGDLWAVFTYDPPPVAGWNSEPSQASPSDTSIAVDTYVNDAASNPISYIVEYSLNGGDSWSDAGHLSGTGLSISGNAISDIATHGDGEGNRSQVAFSWNFTEDESTASTTSAEIRVTPHDTNGDGEPIVSDAFTLRAPPAPPVFAEDSGDVTDITENSVIVHYDMSSVGSAELTHFELHYADDAYYTEHGDYAQNDPVTYTASFSDSGATNVDGLACGTEYHFVQSFTNGDNETATSSDATFTTSDCTGDEGGGDDGGGTYTFPAGDGSADNPYVIESCDDLAGVNDYLSASYVLDTDLDCTEEGNDVMIGNFGTHYFTGTFDGGGHTVDVHLGLSEPAVGLFRGVVNGAIHDLSIGAGSQIYGEEGVGSVAGIAVDSTLSNLRSSAIVVATSPEPEYPVVGAGGIVGGIYGGTLDGAEFLGIVGSPLAAGGIAGIAVNDLSDGTGAIISRSHAGGQVLGGAGVGGIAGELAAGAQVRDSYSSSQVGYYPDFSDGLPLTGGFGGIAGLVDGGTVSRSYASGQVVGGTESDTYPTGGLAGFVSPDTIIVHSFAVASVTSSGAPTAGLIGGVDDSGTFAGTYDDYFDTARTEQAICASGDTTEYDGCTSVDGSADGYWLGTSGTPLSAWNRTDIWDVSGNDGEFPVLRAVSGSLPDESDEFTGADGSGGDEGGNDSEEAPQESHPRHGFHGSGSAAGFPGVNGNATYADLLSQLSGLAVQYQSLAAKLSAAPLPVNGRDLTLGASGSDVTALQTFLISHGYSIAAGATGYFGAQTRAALAAYQKANGIAPAAGYFGPLTRASIAAKGSAGS